MSCHEQCQNYTNIKRNNSNNKTRELYNKEVQHQNYIIAKSAKKSNGKDNNITKQSKRQLSN